MRLFALVLFATFNLWANLHQAPPNFTVQGQQLVFVDIQTIDSKITYDLNSSKAIAESTITFYQPVVGNMIFDLVESPIQLSLDGQSVSSSTTSMQGTSTVRYLNVKSIKGMHTLTVKNEIKKNVSFNSDHVRSAFWMSDLSDRRYMEQYLPSNLEFDQYKQNLEIKVNSQSNNQVLYANGDVKELALNHWQISFPLVYTASSFFFHLTKKGMIPEEKSTYRSIDNRIIPITVYTTQSTSRFMTEAKRVLAELEKDYGPFAHNQVIIYGAGSGGMEHCGATITSYYALGHELTHSYFARGIMPVHGNSGWVDEAIASWRDDNYPGKPWFMSADNMGAHSVYERTTDRDAYTKGRDFIAYLNDKVTKAGKSHFKVFLKEFFRTRVFVPFKTAEFKAAIENFYGVDLKDDFDKYILNKKAAGMKSAHKHVHNPMHPKLTPKQLMDLL